MKVWRLRKAKVAPPKLHVFVHGTRVPVDAWKRKVKVYDLSLVDVGGF